MKQISGKYATPSDINSAASALEQLIKEWANQQIEISLLNAIPTGSCFVWSASTPPSGFLICDGSVISRTTYSKLFTTIGVAFGAGDGSTTFNLPNCTDFSPWQSGTVAVGNYGLGSAPNITGNIGFIGGTQSGNSCGGAFASTKFTNGSQSGIGGGLGNSHLNGVTFDASRSSAVYIAADRIVPAWVSMKWCIKY